MQFRLRVSTPKKFSDLVLPEGSFIVGGDPQQPPPNIFVSYLLKEHVRFDTSKDACIASLLIDQAYTTTYNGKPFARGVQSLKDGDLLDIREQNNPDFCITIRVETLVLREANAFISPILYTSSVHQLPPGLSRYSTRFLPLLPEIYQPTIAFADDYSNDSAATFLARLLALLESEFLPLAWTATNFDLLLDPRTAPDFFLPWLENWFDVGGDWDEKARRALFATYLWRGTRFGLQRLLEIYTGCRPTIHDSKADDPSLETGSFRVILPFTQQEIERREINLGTIKRLIDFFKPVHTSYTLCDVDRQKQDC